MSKLERFMRFAHPQVLVAHLLKLRRPRPEWIARGLSAKWPYGNSYQFAMGRRPELVHLVEPLLYSNDGYVVSSAISVIHDVKPELLVKH
ncbi:MAG TPA: hypothetical protein VGQ00_04730, partial [Candidatus Norongarragalinales archaeon]|nr:hypothetical protein [Candidatus Norongarragalinales archaeon]